MPDHSKHPKRESRTTVTLSAELSGQIGSLVGRHGRTKAEVIAAGLESLEDRAVLRLIEAKDRELVESARSQVRAGALA